jgi:hypothetical protein
LARKSKRANIFCLINIFTRRRQNGRISSKMLFFWPASLVHRDGALVSSVCSAWLLVELGAGGFFGCRPSVGPSLLAYERFIQGVCVIAVCHIEVQVVDVEARWESFPHCCGDVMVARVECVAGSSNTTTMHRLTKRA